MAIVTNVVLRYIISEAFYEKTINEEFQSKSDSQSLQQAVLDALPYVLSDLDPAVLSSLSYSRKDMLKWCTYNGRKCLDDEFSEMVDPDSGKCFSFNSDWRNYADRSGEKNGKVVLNFFKF